jgi:peptidoglycan/xylan/chitin deacetylase (PgdA/CDA1 family)
MIMDRSMLNRRKFVSRLALGVAAPVAAITLRTPDPAGAVVINISGVVAAGGGVLNVRTGPSTARPVIYEAPAGAALALLQTSSDWFKVRVAGVTGWAHSEYIAVNGTSARVLTKGIETRPRVALTFDAGSDAGFTSQILDILARYRVPASFGLTGDWANQYPDLVRRIANNRHQMLNHTLNHPSYTGYSTSSPPLSPAKRISQLVAAEETLIRIAGVGAGAYWRPPFGDYDAAALRESGAIGKSRCTMWTIDSLGWDGYSAAQIRDRVLSRISNGAIVLFHVGSASQDGNALESIIKSLRGSGYQFGTVRQTVLPS